MNMQQNRIESISDDIYKPLAGLNEEVSKDCSEEHECHLSPAISEVGKQQFTKPPYAGIRLRGSHRKGCSHLHAQNRMSCPEFLMKIPENTVVGSLPLVLNSNMSRSYYSLGTWCTDDEAEGDRTVGHLQSTNHPLSAELRLSEEETGAPHHSVVKSSANKVHCKIGGQRFQVTADSCR